MGCHPHQIAQGSSWREGIPISFMATLSMPLLYAQLGTICGNVMVYMGLGEVMLI